MGQIVTQIGEPAAILAVGGAWAAMDGNEEFSVPIPIAYKVAAVNDSVAGIVINISIAIETETTINGDSTLKIYQAADNVLRDTDHTVTLTIGTNGKTTASTPFIFTRSYRMDELGPSIVLSLATADTAGTLTPTVSVRRWYYVQAA